MQSAASVLIVGAGPSGLVLALSLLQNGVSVRIIDKEPRYRVGSRGFAIQPRSQELHKVLGTLPGIEAVARPAQTVKMYQAPGGVKPIRALTMFPYTQPTAAYPYANVLILGQDNHEAVLRSHLEKHHCFVELGTELKSFDSQHPDHVVAEIIVTSDGVERRETANFSWLVGTDGAHSVVRKQLGITFLGETRTVENFVIGDIHVSGGLDKDFWHFWGSPASKCFTLCPTVTADPKDDDCFTFGALGHELDCSTVASSREELIKAFYEVTGRNDVTFGDLVWISHYRPNIRMANKFGEGRVFVAGDAAHIHSPTGGQGMNSGIQDSFNLGWKLSLVHKGLAPPSLLESYTQERLPVIAAMLNITTTLLNKAFQAGTEGSASSWTRGEEFKQLGVNYRGSPIVVDHTPNAGKNEFVDPYRSGGGQGDLRGGDRAPDGPGLAAVLGPSITHIFDLFGSTYHTVLIFSAGVETQKAVLDAVKRYPEGTIRTVIVLPRGHATPPAEDIVADHLILRALRAHLTREGVVLISASKQILSDSHLTFETVRTVVGLVVHKVCTSSAKLPKEHG